MKKLIYLLSVLPLISIATSCSSIENVAVKDLNGSWKIVSVKGEKVSKEELPYFNINLNDKKLHGNTGCNIVNTSLTFDDMNANKVKFTQPMSTMMACPYLELENKITKAMEEVSGIKKGKINKELILVDNEGNELLILDKSNADNEN